MNARPLATGLRLLREQHGLSIAELARRGGTTSVTVSRLEHGHIPANEGHLAAYAFALGLSPTLTLSRAARLAAAADKPKPTTPESST